jgi:hypothetical protein
MADDPQIQTKIFSPACTKAYNLAITEYNYSMQVLFYPLILSFLNIIVMCSLIYFNVPLNKFYIIASTLFTTNPLTQTILLNTYPKWLINWSITLTSTKDEIDLEIIRNRLLDIKTELTEIINGKEINIIDLQQLKHEGLMLSQHAEQLAADVQNRSE